MKIKQKIFFKIHFKNAGINQCINYVTAQKWHILTVLSRSYWAKKDKEKLHHFVGCVLFAYKVLVYWTAF
jgi:hypothetical protein